ncbi:hypothetical protein H1R82_13940 [Thermoactinomyces intermedius]|uniref:CDI immunity protein domain-containing protein n=1 Tax=Thermoactinomyces intermedius TaxID=2024 RepID=A0A8I1DFX0_THEIN|nr:ribonuclease toxin immunity protein CdiI [Thermoactinomyces intermedius]MBA4550087.1 hypothetical protein [Thermoactinomyces intermedius]MBA4837723.1 hypothetical protein [Thermoactinomyces intermedius]MBH8596412.1 hypothetical protein [Thermoactinomyces intermedius]
MYQYFFMLVGNYYFVDCLDSFKNKRGFGIEEVMILFRQSFDEWERFRCQENEVALVMYYPAAEEDTIGYMDFKEFYPYVYKRAQEYISSHPKRKEEVTRLLKEIKESWGI